MKRLLSVILCAAVMFSAVCLLPQADAGSAVLTVCAAEKKPYKDMLPYAYSELNKEERECYLRMRRAVIDHKSSLSITADERTFRKVTKMLCDIDVLTDFVLENVSYSYMVGYVFEARFEYGYSKSDYDAIIGKAEEASKTVISKFGKKSGDYSKVKYIHDYIARKAVYDLKSANINNISGALYDKKAKCDGYSHAFEYICRRAGIDAVTVVGYSRGEGHAWNKVRVNGKWYNVDVTWDDSESNRRDNTEYNYFLLSDKDIGSDHEQLETDYAVPEAVTSGKDYYSRNGLYAKSLGEAKEKLEAAVSEAAKKGKKSVTVRFADKQTYDDAVRSLGREDDMFPLLRKVGRNSAPELITDYFQYTSCGENIYTLTVYIFYKDTKMSDYYKDISLIDDETLKYLEMVGIEKR